MVYCTAKGEQIHGLLYYYIIEGTSGVQTKVSQIVAVLRSWEVQNRFHLKHSWIIIIVYTAIKV